MHGMTETSSTEPTRNASGAEGGGAPPTPGASEPPGLNADIRADRDLQLREQERALERALVERAQAGDFDAFEALVTRHEGRVYTTAMRILRQREDAEDVVQTVFLKALEKIRDFRGEATFGTWINRVATNTALNVLRKKRGLPIAAPLDFDNDEPRLEITDQVADWREHAMSEMDRLELRRALEAAIDVLPDNYRLVFVLRDLEGLSVRDTSEVLGISPSNVKVRLLRARLVLREQLTRVLGDHTRSARKPVLVQRLERGEAIPLVRHADADADAATASAPAGQLKSADAGAAGASDGDENEDGVPPPSSSDASSTATGRSHHA